MSITFQTSWLPYKKNGLKYYIAVFTDGQIMGRELVL